MGDERKFTQMVWRHLHYLIKAAEHGSLRRAAKELAVEESAVSRRIRDLEDELGVSLFNRSHKGVMLTHAGEIFLDYARRAISEIELGMIAAGQCGRGQLGCIRIGLPSSITSEAFGDLIKCFSMLHAEIRIDYIEGTLIEHIRAIQCLNVDVAFLTGADQPDRCELTELWLEPVFVALPLDHRLAHHDQLTWSELAECSFLIGGDDEGRSARERIVSNFTRVGHRPDFECHAVRHGRLMQMVAIGHGLTLASEAMAQTRYPGVAFRALAEEFVPFCALWAADNDNPALRRLLSLANSKVGNLSDRPFKSELTAP